MKGSIKISELETSTVINNAASKYMLPIVSDVHEKNTYEVYKTYVSDISDYVGDTLDVVSAFDDLEKLKKHLNDTESSIKTSYGKIYNDVQSTYNSIKSSAATAASTYSSLSTAYSNLRTYANSNISGLSISGTLNNSSGYIINYKLGLESGSRSITIPKASSSTYGLVTYNELKDIVNSSIDMGAAGESAQGAVTGNTVKNLAAEVKHEPVVNVYNGSQDAYIVANLTSNTSSSNLGVAYLPKAGNGASEWGVTTINTLDSVANTSVPDREYNVSETQYPDIQLEHFTDNRTTQYQQRNPYAEENAYGTVTGAYIKRLASDTAHKVNISMVGETLSYNIDGSTTVGYCYDGVTFPHAGETTYGFVTGTYINNIISEANEKLVGGIGNATQTGEGKITLNQVRQIAKEYGHVAKINGTAATANPDTSLSTPQKYNLQVDIIDSAKDSTTANKFPTTSNTVTLPLATSSSPNNWGLLQTESEVVAYSNNYKSIYQTYINNISYTIAGNEVIISAAQTGKYADNSLLSSKATIPTYGATQRGIINFDDIQNIAKEYLQTYALNPRGNLIFNFSPELIGGGIYQFIRRTNLSPLTTSDTNSNENNVTMPPSKQYEIFKKLKLNQFNVEPAFNNAGGGLGLVITSLTTGDTCNPVTSQDSMLSYADVKNLVNGYDVIKNFEGVASKSIQDAEIGDIVVAKLNSKGLIEKEYLIDRSHYASFSYPKGFQCVGVVCAKWGWFGDFINIISPTDMLCFSPNMGREPDGETSLRVPLWGLTMGIPTNPKLKFRPVSRFKPVGETNPSNRNILDYFTTSDTSLQSVGEDGNRNLYIRDAATVTSNKISVIPFTDLDVNRINDVFINSLRPDSVRSENAFADNNGLVNTVLGQYVVGTGYGNSWKTDSTIVNTADATHSPALACCLRYCGNLTEYAGKWYMPSATELAVAMFYNEVINNSLKEIINKDIGSHSTNKKYYVNTLSNANYYSSTEAGVNHVTGINLVSSSNLVVSNIPKNGYAMTRAILRKSGLINNSTTSSGTVNITVKISGVVSGVNTGDIIIILPDGNTQTIAKANINNSITVQIPQIYLNGNYKILGVPLEFKNYNVGEATINQTTTSVTIPLAYKGEWSANINSNFKLNVNSNNTTFASKIKFGLNDYDLGCSFTGTQLKQAAWNSDRKTYSELPSINFLCNNTDDYDYTIGITTNVGGQKLTDTTYFNATQKILTQDIVDTSEGTSTTTTNITMYASIKQFRAKCGLRVNLRIEGASFPPDMLRVMVGVSKETSDSIGVNYLDRATFYVMGSSGLYGGIMIDSTVINDVINSLGGLTTDFIRVRIDAWDGGNGTAIKGWSYASVSQLISTFDTTASYITREGVLICNVDEATFGGVNVYIKPWDDDGVQCSLENYQTMCAAIDSITLEIYRKNSDIVLYSLGNMSKRNPPNSSAALNRFWWYTNEQITIDRNVVDFSDTFKLRIGFKPGFQTTQQVGTTWRSNTTWYFYNDIDNYPFFEWNPAGTIHYPNYPTVVASATNFNYSNYIYLTNSSVCTLSKNINGQLNIYITLQTPIA